MPRMVLFPAWEREKKEFNLGPGKQDAKGLICSGFHNFGEERRLAWLVKSLSRSLLETEILLAIGFLVSRNENDFFLTVTKMVQIQHHHLLNI